MENLNEKWLTQSLQSKGYFFFNNEYKLQLIGETTRKNNYVQYMYILTRWYDGSISIFYELYADFDIEDNEESLIDYYIECRN